MDASRIVGQDMMLMETRIDIIGLPRHDLADRLSENSFDVSLIRRLWSSIYVRGATAFSQISSIGRQTQARLADRFVIGRPSIARELTSTDATVKWVLQFADGHSVETVLIPEPDRGALCLSTQVGCSLTCRFCHTGTMKLARNLTAGEIVSQAVVARDRLSEWGLKRRDCRFTNVVLMGRLWLNGHRFWGSKSTVESAFVGDMLLQKCQQVSFKWFQSCNQLSHPNANRSMSAYSTNSEPTDRHLLSHQR